MRIDILTLFPEMCDSVLSQSIIGRARGSGKVEICCHQIREYTENRHNNVDDAPYGGGMGMIMQAQPIYDCFSSLCERLGSRPHLIYMSPQGRTLTQQRALEISKYENVAVLCGHYEGVDQRVIDEIVDEEISIGDYVLTGGELAAMVLCDCVVRLLPGVLPNEDCFSRESHFNFLLEHEQYTRPPSWRGRQVPQVLLSGHHENIEKYRRRRCLLRTLERRPQLLSKAVLSEQDLKFLTELGSKKHE